jgi:hypothetical protein
MGERLDAYLTRKAQAVDDTALVVCQDDPQNKSGQRWVLRRQAGELELGDNFGRAREALRVWMHAQRATKR